MMNARMTFAMGCLLLIAGCSATGAAWEGVRIGKNLAREDSHLKVSLDGHVVAQNKLIKGYKGYASFECPQPVSTAPNFRFEGLDAAKTGRVTGTYLQIHQRFDNDYSDQAEFSITPRSSGAENAMKPATTYNLASPGGQFRVTDFNGNEVSGVTLKPDTDYLMVFTVTGDRSESMQILFKTQ